MCGLKQQEQPAGCAVSTIRSAAPHWKDLETIAPPLITSIKPSAQAISTDCLAEEEIGSYFMKVYQFHRHS